MKPPKKACNECRVQKPLDEFRRSSYSRDGRKSRCAECCREYDRSRSRGTPRREPAPAHDEQDLEQEAADAQWRAERSSRLESRYESLRPEDFDVSVGNDGRIDKEASKQKRQEYSKAMGEFAHNMAAGDLSERDGHYIGGLAEQEFRFGNRRVARTVSLLAAHEALALRNFKAAAKEYLSDRITPTGYAYRPSKKAIKRSVVLILSDLHIGARLSELDNPIGYSEVQEARRLEYVVRQAVDFKPQYRVDSELVLVLNGDMVEGLLLHDIRDGAPLTEQMLAFWVYFRAVLGLVSQTFPKVRVVCQPGNHGRNKLRHPGRATSSKWDGVEYQLYYALSMMASGLPNVSFDVGFRALSIVDLHGSRMAVTHGDTEVKIGHPDRAAEQNALELAKINAGRVYGEEIHAWVFGHFHTPRFHPGKPSALYNGMLVPPNGYARGAGYTTQQCGQWLFEAVEGHPIGDLRYIDVGPAQDKDERLGTIVKPFRLT